MTEQDGLQSRHVSAEQSNTGIAYDEVVEAPKPVHGPVPKCFKDVLPDNQCSLPRGHDGDCGFICHDGDCGFISAGQWYFTRREAMPNGD